MSEQGPKPRKFTVTFKDPDVLHDAIARFVDAELAGPLGEALSPSERQAVRAVRIEEIGEHCAQWFEHGETARIEIDLNADTCTGLKR